MALRMLHPLLAEKATLNLNETPEKMQDSLKVIKEWISEQPHLNARTEDQFLAAFIRAAKFDLTVVKRVIDLFYTCRGSAPEFYRIHHKDDVFREILETGCYMTLPAVSDPAAPRVALIRPGVYDSSKHSILDVFSAIHIIDKILLIDDDNSVVAGNINIIDLKGISFITLLLLSPQQLKKLIVSQQDSMPLRGINAFFINTPQGFDTIITAIAGMLDDKEKKEFQVYSENYEDMYRFVPRDILPEEYGGNRGNLSDIIEYWRDKVEQYSEWLDEDLQYGTFETKRPGGPKTGEDMFGASASESSHLSLISNMMELTTKFK